MVGDSGALRGCSQHLPRVICTGGGPASSCLLVSWRRRGDDASGGWASGVTHPSESPPSASPPGYTGLCVSDTLLGLPQQRTTVGWTKQQKLIVSEIWRLEVCGQTVNLADSLTDLWGRICPVPLPERLGVCWPSLMALGLQPHPHPRFTLMWLSLCACACPQHPLFVRTAAILDEGSRTPSLLTNCIFNDLISKPGHILRY